MLRKWWAMTLALLLCCAPLCACDAPLPRHQQIYYDLFDTVTVIVGYERDAAAFAATAQLIHDALLQYHQLYDIYYAYSGINNLYTVNTQAAQAPVQVDARIIDLLQFGKDMHRDSGGAVNIAMGAVLRLWHDCRAAAAENPEQAALPDVAVLQAAAAHCDIDDLVIDAAAGTVAFSDAWLQVDVGAIAKGYALQQVCAAMRAGGLAGYSVSLGGNVCTIGPRPDGQPWQLAVQEPETDSSAYACRLEIQEGSLVTSGSYQRFYTVDGKQYHHIIDPETLMPGSRYRSVTVLCRDSGLADALSTALFNLSPEEGEALLARYDNANAMWIDAAGNCSATKGFLECCTQWQQETAVR